MNEADAILIGVGAGMSAADGFTYGGHRFTEAFPDFIDKYSWLDMFQASVFDFEDLNEEWSFFSRFVDLNYFSQPVGHSYLNLRNLLKGKTYHIITSNADNSFEVANFPENQVYNVQGKYNLLQCSKGCHNKRYDNEVMIKEMLANEKDMKVSDDLIPYCPVCQEPMELNRRNHSDWMVEDDQFNQEKLRYDNFIEKYKNQKLLILELGCGYMAPQVIKHPFQDLASKLDTVYITVNLKDYSIPEKIKRNTIWIQENIRELFKNMM
ncbi:deacetylase SIR2 [Jeotgalicoccus huakuii]|nr:deacetylase SIR2 [Jeotgalicoccus huakuii]